MCPSNWTFGRCGRNGYQVGCGANGKFDGTAPSTYSGASTGVGDVNLGLNPVPEPGTLALLARGLACLGVRRRRS